MRLIKWLLTVIILAALVVLGALQAIWSNLRAALVAIEYLTR